MSEVLNVELREITGKRRNKRLRLNEGKIPAIIYGHGAANVMLSISEAEFSSVLRHGSHVVTLKGALDEQALIKEIQWNTWGVSVYHVDFARVRADEKVVVVLPLKFKGECPGLNAGGILNQNIHEIHVECPVISIPEHIDVNVSELEIGGHIAIKDVQFPKNVKPMIDAEEIIVHCELPKEEEEPVAAAEGADAEPEVVGRKKTEEEEPAK